VTRHRVRVGSLSSWTQLDDGSFEHRIDGVLQAPASRPPRPPPPDDADSTVVPFAPLTLRPRELGRTNVCIQSTLWPLRIRFAADVPDDVWFRFLIVTLEGAPGPPILAEGRVGRAVMQLPRPHGWCRPGTTFRLVARADDAPLVLRAYLVGVL